MNTDEIESVNRAASSFMNKMEQWERRCLELDVASRESDDDDDKAVTKKSEALRKIFNEHLTKKASSRNQSRYDLLNYGQPPVFGRGITNIAPAGPSAYWVYTPHIFGTQIRYHFVIEDGSWRIDYKETEVDPGKWKKQLDI